MARPKATAEQRDAQRRAIRRAAADLYTESGVGGISVRAVATRAGVSTGTLYSYFANLGDLMRSLWMDTVDAANRDLEAIAAAHADPIERIQALLNRYIVFAHDNPAVYRGVLMFVRPDASTKPEAAPLEEAPLYRLLHVAVAEAAGRGQVETEDTGKLAQLLWAGVHGAIAIPDNLDTFAFTASKELATDMVDLLIRSLR